MLTIDTSVNFLLYLRNLDRLDNLKLYSVFASGFLIDHALSLFGCYIMDLRSNFVKVGHVSVRNDLMAYCNTSLKS